MQRGLRLTGCESWVRWAYFQEKYHNSQKYAQPFEELLMFIAHGHIFEKLLYFSGLLEMQAHSKDFCTGVTWVSDMYGCMYNNARLGGVWAHAPPWNFFRNHMLWDCFWGHLGQKQSRSSSVHYMACRVLYPIFECPCTHLLIMHLLSQLTSNFHERRYYSWQYSRWGWQIVKLYAENIETPPPPLPTGLKSIRDSSPDPSLSYGSSGTLWDYTIYTRHTNTKDYMLVITDWSWVIIGC